MSVAASAQASGVFDFIAKALHHSRALCMQQIQMQEKVFHDLFVREHVTCFWVHALPLAEVLKQADYAGF